MKTLIFTIALCMAVCGLSAQELSTEEIKKLQEENEYLRKSLNINESITKKESNKVEFSITKVTGNSSSQTVSISLLLTNKEANKNFQFAPIKAIDAQGNSYTGYSSSLREMIYTDVPVKYTIEFAKVLPEVKLLKLVDVSYYGSSPGRTVSVEFKDLAVDWSE